MSGHIFRNSGERYQCWVCGGTEENLPARYHFITVWTVAGERSSKSVTVHAGACWRILESLFRALAPELPLLSDSADDERPGLNL